MSTKQEKDGLSSLDVELGKLSGERGLLEIQKDGGRA